MLFWLYQFWGLFSTLSQVAILLTASLASFASVLFIQRRGASAYFSTLAALVAFTYFVLNVAMLGQLFSINPRSTPCCPRALCAVAGLCLPNTLAIGCRSQLIHRVYRASTWRNAGMQRLIGFRCWMSNLVRTLRAIKSALQQNSSWVGGLSHGCLN
uniref:hypothetical protein n=1 Tax=Pseudomonas sp. TMP25 TaxID=3136561 RepID=UPI0040485217